MKDAELIARLRMIHEWKIGKEAADRIELLATTNEQLVATNEALSISNATLIAERDALFRRAALAEEWRDHDKSRAEAAEAKLSKTEGLLAECLERNALLEARLRKAVETLNALDVVLDLNGWDIDSIAREDIRTTLAELKGESHE